MTKFEKIETILMTKITLKMKNLRDDNNRDTEVMKNMLIISIMMMNMTIAVKATIMMMIMVKLGMLFVIMLIKIMISNIFIINEDITMMEIIKNTEAVHINIMACRSVARQRPRNKQLYNSRCKVMAL
jgi:hypothetical protein